MWRDTEDDLPRLEAEYKAASENAYALEHRIRRIKEIAANRYRGEFFKWLSKDDNKQEAGNDDT